MKTFIRPVTGKLPCCNSRVQQEMLQSLCPQYMIVCRTRTSAIKSRISDKLLSTAAYCTVIQYITLIVTWRQSLWINDIVWSVVFIIERDSSRKKRPAQSFLHTVCHWSCSPGQTGRWGWDSWFCVDFSLARTRLSPPSLSPGGQPRTELDDLTQLLPLCNHQSLSLGFLPHAYTQALMANHTWDHTIRYHHCFAQALNELHQREREREKNIHAHMNSVI